MSTLSITRTPQVPTYAFGSPVCLHRVIKGKPLAARTPDGEFHEGVLHEHTSAPCKNDGGEGCSAIIIKHGERHQIRCATHELCTGQVPEALT